MIIGLTGGTGTGKTSVSQIFADAGFETVDFDKVTRSLYEKSSDCLCEIVQGFGKEILFPDGTLNRRLLGEIVFADKNSLCKLESIVFKYILLYADSLIKASKGKNLLLDAPTLFESNLNKRCDFTIAVIADKSIRKERIIKRDLLSEDAAENRINSQKDNEFFKNNCDFIIENNKDLAELKKQTEKVLNKILR